MLGQSGYSLTCDVTGAENLNPSITYWWTKNNGTQTQVQVAADPSVLSFSPLRLSDAGRYTCRATVSSPYLNSDITMMDTQDITLQSELINLSCPCTCLLIQKFNYDGRVTCIIK